MKRIKTIVFCVLCGLSSGVYAQEMGLTQSEIAAAQKSSFADWKADMSCQYVEDNIDFKVKRVFHFIAERGSTPTIKRRVFNNVNSVKYGDFESQSWNLNDNTKLTMKKYKPEQEAGYLTLSTSSSNGGRKFTFETKQGTRTVLVYPSGFYVAASQNTNGSRTLYLQGC